MCFPPSAGLAGRTAAVCSQWQDSGILPEQITVSPGSCSRYRRLVSSSPKNENVLQHKVSPSRCLLLQLLESHVTSSGLSFLFWKMRSSGPAYRRQPFCPSLFLFSHSPLGSFLCYSHRHSLNFFLESTSFVLFHNLKLTFISSSEPLACLI